MNFNPHSIVYLPKTKKKFNWEKVIDIDTLQHLSDSKSIDKSIGKSIGKINW